MTLVLPLAVILGYFLVDPMDPSSVAVVGAVLSALLLPLMMQWYHPILIFLWNAAMAPAFLPGSPALWMPVALVGLLIAVLNRSVNRSFQFISVPSITYPLFFLLAVMGITAYFSGGIGSQLFGSSSFGGRRYFSITLAVIGYLVLISRRIPARRAALYISLFFLSGLTALVPDILGMAGNSTSFLYQIFPPDFTAVAAVSGAMDFGGLFRIYGLTAASPAIFFVLLARFGIRGVFEPGKVWRTAFFFLALAAGVYSGFRSILILLLLTFVIQFFMEGLHRTRALPVLLGTLFVGGGLILSQAERLPLVMQRTISFLPVSVNPVAKYSATDSLEWRLEMWKEVLPEVSKYLWMGKGHSISPTEMYFSGDRRMNQSYYWAIVSGDYHNGPLSVVIPLGIWGVIAFGWFCVASLRYLYRNCRYGPAELRSINTFLFVCFATRVSFFVVFFGSFWSDLALFTGLAGLAVSINGPEPAKAAQPELQSADEQIAEQALRDDYA